MKIIKIVVMMLLLFTSVANASIITQTDTIGNTAVVDDAGLYWYPSTSFFAPGAHQGNYSYVLSQIDKLNDGNYFGFSDWRLATHPEFISMYESTRVGTTSVHQASPIGDNFVQSYSEFHYLREILYEEKHYNGILAGSVMAPTAVLVNGKWVDVWNPGHYLADMYFTKFYGSDQYLNMDTGSLFWAEYKRMDSNFVNARDLQFINYGAWVVSEGYVQQPMLMVARSQTSPVPIPAAVWLLGSGLIALVGLRRRKNV